MRHQGRNGRDRWVWLELVDRDGPFVAVPALKRAWPQGMPPSSDAARAELRDKKPHFDRAWDEWNRDPDGDQVLADYRLARDSWVEAVLRTMVGWGAELATGPAALPSDRVQASSPDGRYTVGAKGGFVHDGTVGMLVNVVDPVRDLRDPGADGWSATSIDRMEILLRQTGHQLGLVTDGRWWGLVSAADATMTASGVVDAQTWMEEPEVRDAFWTLLAPKTIAGGKGSFRLAALFRDSVAAAEEITAALGTQVRRAVELLVSAFSDAAVEVRRRGDGELLPKDREQVYEAAVTVMMRVVFLLFAEERSLMPESSLYADAYSMSERLDTLERRLLNEGGESLDATSETWHRLLSTSQALYGGVTVEDVRLPAYGGSLFDPSRFPFLLAENVEHELAIEVSDRVMLEVLRSVQMATVGGERRRVSFRDVDVEQIGYIYEGLLGYSCHDVEEVTLGLIGREGAEPEIPLDALDDLAEANLGDDGAFVEALLEWLKGNQPAAETYSSGRLKKELLRGEVRDDIEQLLRGATADGVLRDRLRPYVGIIRQDLRGRLVVIEPGGLVVVETPSRATNGAHYTPKDLAQEVVLHALEPLVYQPGPYQTSDQEQWKLIGSSAILGLKIADIACGSGAFLVSAAEYLADRLVEAWHQEGVATGSPAYQRKLALRQVVANCLYGVDINPMAVEMCKISLWLVSLDRTKPFSFVDDKILCGNSLLGITDVRQLMSLHIDPSRTENPGGDYRLFDTWGDRGFVGSLDVRAVLHQAADIRRQLASPVDDADPQRATRTKANLWKQYGDLVGVIRHVADGVIAAGLEEGGKPGKRLDAAYERLANAVDVAYAPGGKQDTTALDQIVDHGLTPQVPTDYERWQPLHWAIAFPDVVEHGGFDAIVGNPPFLGGKKITPNNGSNVREWLVNVIAGGLRGNADMVAYFFLRAFEILRDAGTLGLMATNTIAQGDTREVGLDQLKRKSFEIVRAIRSRTWPATSAKVEYSAVWGSKGVVSAVATRECDGRVVDRISTLLEAEGREGGSPVQLAENQKMAYIGTNVNCVDEFCVPIHVAEAWISADHRLSAVIRPYVSGEDLYQRPSVDASRWIVDFSGVPDSKIREYEEPFEWLYRRARPARQLLTNKPRLQRRWWAYEAPAVQLRRLQAQMREVLAITRVSFTLMPVRASADSIFSEGTVVFATESFATEAVLSSSPHVLWATKYSSQMRFAPRYGPSDVFETFPQPRLMRGLGGIGEDLDIERRGVMLRRNWGLTELYNRINDPGVDGAADADIARIREIHVELDRAVLAAYGWDDVELDYGFHTYRQMRRWTVGPAARVEILDRLLEENHRRAAAQGTESLSSAGEDEPEEDE